MVQEALNWVEKNLWDDEDVPGNEDCILREESLGQRMTMFIDTKVKIPGIFDRGIPLLIMTCIGRLLFREVEIKA